MVSAEQEKQHSQQAKALAEGAKKEADVARNLAEEEQQGAETARKVSAFRVFRTQLREAFADYQSPFVSIDVLLTWATQRFAAVEVRHDVRRSGRSNYTGRMLLGHALNMTTGFSVLPLQLASMAGFAFTLLGFGLLAFVLGRYLIEDRRRS